AALEERHLARERDDARHAERARVVHHGRDEPRAEALPVVIGPHGERANLAEVVPQEAQRAARDDLVVGLGDVELADALEQLAHGAREQDARRDVLRHDARDAWHVLQRGAAEEDTMLIGLRAWCAGGMSTPRDPLLRGSCRSVATRRALRPSW